MFNARQLMIFYFYGTCNQKATIIQFQKLKEKAKTEEPKMDIQDLIDFVAEYKDTDNYRWFFWESWLDIDMHRAEGENSFIDAMNALTISEDTSVASSRYSIWNCHFMISFSCSAFVSCTHPSSDSLFSRI